MIPRELPAWMTPVTMTLSYFRLSISGMAILAPIAMPATLNPFIADMATIRPMVPMAKPPWTGPVQTWNMR